MIGTDSQMRILAIAATLMTLAAAPTVAQDSPPQGWQTWTWKGSCFALLYPSEGAIAELNKPKAYLSIKNTPAEQAHGSVAIVSGIDDAAGLSGQVDVDGNVFQLLMFNGNGYVKTGAREDALLAAMSTGKEARVTWSSKSGMIVQTYQLEGMAQAKRSIDMSCYPNG